MLGVRFELSFVRAAAAPAAFVGAALAAGPFEKERAGSVVQRDSISVRAPAAAVHALLDPASAGNRWRLRRDSIETLDARRGVFRLIDKKLPELPFELSVLRSTQPLSIASITRAEDRRPLGAVVSSMSAYEIAATDSGGVRVTLCETTDFVAGLSPFQRAFEALLIRFSLRIDLLRLKHEAELGSDADAD